MLSEKSIVNKFTYS